MAADAPNNWRELCVAASQERDPGKLLELVRQITEALTPKAQPEQKKLAS